MWQLLKLFVICLITYAGGQIAGHMFEPASALFMYWGGMAYMALARNA